MRKALAATAMTVAAFGATAGTAAASTGHDGGDDIQNAQQNVHQNVEQTTNVEHSGNFLSVGEVLEEVNVLNGGINVAISNLLPEGL